MRVLHVDLGREMRGGQWQVLQLLQALGPEHTLLARANSPLHTLAQGQGIPSYPFSPFALLPHSRAVDLVHAHDARAHTWLALFPGPPLVVSRRVAFPIRKSVVSKWKYQRPAHFIAVSQFICGEMLKAQIPNNKVKVVYDGVNLSAFAPRPGSEPPSGLLALETMDRMKGTDLVRQAARIVGLPVTYSKDLVRDLPSAGLFVYATHSEGLGSAALLAMAAGVPVVASRVGGLPEVVEDGVTGVLAGNTPEEFASAIRSGLAARARMGTAARKRAAQFSVERMARETMEVYQRVSSLWKG